MSDIDVNVDAGASEVIVGSRRSPLALWQSNWVISQMGACEAAAASPVRMNFVVRDMTTFGDRHFEPILELGATGVFTKDLETALLTGRIDMAVHSLKDVATVVPRELCIAAVCERADYRDVLVSSRYASLAALPLGAKLGTGSPRRMAQLKRFRRDLEFVPIRGNVETRLQKMADMGLDGIILAAAGLDRLGYSHLIRERIGPEVCLPAPGQGALCVEMKENGRHVGVLAPLLVQVNHLHTAVTTGAERAFLAAVGGGCSAAVGALGEMDASGETITLHAIIGRVADGAASAGWLKGPVGDASALARELAERLLKDGLHGR